MISQKRTRREESLSTAFLTNMKNTLFSLVGRGRLELPTNGLKVPGARGAQSERAPENPRAVRMVNGVHGRFSHHRICPCSRGRA